MYINTMHVKWNYICEIEYLALINFLLKVLLPLIEATFVKQAGNDRSGNWKEKAFYARIYLKTGTG